LHLPPSLLLQDWHTKNSWTGYTFDDHVTEPESRRYYEWLILDPDVPDDEKGDWTIDAHGSNALVEQALERIRAKTFGICEDCEGVISKKRLEAIPFAALCIRCAEKLEQPSSHRPRQPR
jgi:hypothetical protein